MKKKAEAGAQFLFTQPVFERNGFQEWMDAVRHAGLHERFHIIASVRPLASSDQAEALRQRHPGTVIPDDVVARLRHAADPAQEGLLMCAELAACLLILSKGRIQLPHTFVD